MHVDALSTLKSVSGGAAGSQSTPRPAARSAIPATSPRAAHASTFLTAEQSAKEVFGVSLRTFHHLRERGLLPDPIILGERCLRWVRAELEEAALNLPRKSREETQRPASLRRRVDKHSQAADGAGA